MRVRVAVIAMAVSMVALAAPAAARVPVLAPWKLGLTVHTAAGGLAGYAPDAVSAASELATRLTLAHGPCVSDPSCLLPNDPGLSFSWGLQNDDHTVAIPGTHPVVGADIDAPRAWAYAKSSPAVRIAIVDTGIDAGHEDLAGKVVDTVVVVGSDGIDRVGHGTAVAGVAAAIPDNGKGITGAGYNASLINVKVADTTTGGSDPTIDCNAAAQGIVSAVNHGAQVINVSAETATPCPALENAVNYARIKNALVIAAAGNEGSSAPHYPAAYPNALAVAATDNADRPAGFTNANAGWIDLAAPGVAIGTTLPHYPNVSGIQGYGSVSGTSYAAAYVSGVAALLWPITPDTNGDGLTNDEVARRVLSGADRVAGTGSAWRFGRLNACHAVAPVPARCDEPHTVLIPSGTGSHPAPHSPKAPSRTGVAASAAEAYLRGALAHSFPHSWRDRHGSRRLGCRSGAHGSFRCSSSWRGRRAGYSISAALTPVKLGGKSSWLHTPLRLKICMLHCRLVTGL